jgi:hypothetical protein
MKNIVLALGESRRLFFDADTDKWSAEAEGDRELIKQFGMDYPFTDETLAGEEWGPSELAKYARVAERLLDAKLVSVDDGDYDPEAVY